MAGKIRLACINCDTNEADGVNAAPTDWVDVDDVRPDQRRAARAWFTHLGLCPTCAAEDRRLQANDLFDTMT